MCFCTCNFGLMFGLYQQCFIVHTDSVTRMRDFVSLLLMPSKLIDHALTKTVLRNNTLKMSVNIIQTIQIKYDMSTILDVLEK